MSVESARKKTYSKPEITRVDLAAEEAVLAACKTSGTGQDITKKNTQCLVGLVACYAIANS